jgi:hypothetical protein
MRTWKQIRSECRAEPRAVAAPLVPERASAPESWDAVTEILDRCECCADFRQLTLSGELALCGDCDGAGCAAHATCKRSDAGRPGWEL